MFLGAFENLCFVIFSMPLLALYDLKLLVVLNLLLFYHFTGFVKTEALDSVVGLLIDEHYAGFERFKSFHVSVDVLVSCLHEAFHLLEISVVLDPVLYLIQLHVHLIHILLQLLRLEYCLVCRILIVIPIFIVNFSF